MILIRNHKKTYPKIEQILLASLYSPDITEINILFLQ